MRTFLLATAAAVALAAALPAQGTLQAKKINVPVQYVGTYHMATDTWTGGTRVGTFVLYNCTTPGNYYSNVGNSFATNADHLWIDEGELLDTNEGRVTQVSGFDFAYCSTDLDPTGNGGSVGVLFYDDHGSCATGETATCAYLLSGLPLSTTGNTACWAVAVDLAGGFECSTDNTAMFRTAGNTGKANAAFGWAFSANPGVAGRNNTGPILDLPCAQPLSGCPAVDTSGLQGNQNFFAWEDPAGVWTGCYWFGGVPWASFSMQMYSGSAGANTLAYGYGTNANTLTSTSWVPGLSVTFTSTTSTGGAGVYFLASLATGNLNLGSSGTLVVSTSFLPPTPLPMPGGVLTVPAPVGVPNTVYVQAAETTGPANPSALRALSNGLRLEAGVVQPGGSSNNYLVRGSRTWDVTNKGPGVVTVTYTAVGGATTTSNVTAGTTLQFTAQLGSTFTVTVPAGGSARVDPC
jgi:hypothetical protein